MARIGSWKTAAILSAALAMGGCNEGEAGEPASGAPLYDEAVTPSEGQEPIDDEDGY